MTLLGLTQCRNGVAVPIDAIKMLDRDAWRETCLRASDRGGRLVALPAFAPALAPASAGAEADARNLFAVIAFDADGTLGVARTKLHLGDPYDALTIDWPEAHAFERENYESHGIVPRGHPWLKPLRRGHGAERTHEFFRVDGSEIHEVAVGPVHAGIIEPGHFRFQCAGEEVHHLEIHLGYQHRGAEALLESARPGRRLAVAESIAGDTAVGHALAYCQAVEALSDREPSLVAQVTRGIALEIERLANHVGDLAGLANDVAFLPGAAWFGRLRGDVLNLLLTLSGNRYGRGLVVPGGVRFDRLRDNRKEILARLRALDRDLRITAETLFGSPSVSSRFEQTGVIDRAIAEELGLVGVAARASGLPRDARRDHPSGIFRYALIPVATANSGDVMARALVRWIEIQRSLAFVREQTEELSDGPAFSPIATRLSPRSIVVSMVEGWRGEIAHVVTTGNAGEIERYKVVDPSFHNWFGLAMAMRGNAISDFPLCNKSFNLSYAGHDL